MHAHKKDIAKKKYTLQKYIIKKSINKFIKRHVHIVGKLCFNEEESEKRKKGAFVYVGNKVS